MQHKDSEYLGVLEEELQTAFLEALPVEKRLHGLSPEELLRRFTPDEVLRRFTPEELAAGLSEDQVARFANCWNEGKESELPAHVASSEVARLSVFAASPQVWRLRLPRAFRKATIKAHVAKANAQTQGPRVQQPSFVAPKDDAVQLTLTPQQFAEKFGGRTIRRRCGLFLSNTTR